MFSSISNLIVMFWIQLSASMSSQRSSYNRNAYQLYNMVQNALFAAVMYLRSTHIWSIPKRWSLIDCVHMWAFHDYETRAMARPCHVWCAASLHCMPQDACLFAIMCLRPAVVRMHDKLRRCAASAANVCFSAVCFVCIVVRGVVAREQILDLSEVFGLHVVVDGTASRYYKM